jgi:hypothetical protein
MEILQKYLELLWSCFEYDIHIFSQTWIYAWILIPAMCYTAFFMVKWVVLTAPIWLPFTIITHNLRRLFYIKTKVNYENKKEKEK